MTGLLSDTSPNPPSPRLLAALLHLSLGALFVLGAAALFPRERMAPYYGAAAIMAIWVFKDMIPGISYDLVVEQDSIAGSIADGVGYATGAGLALVSLALSRHQFAAPRIARTARA